MEKSSSLLELQSDSDDLIGKLRLGEAITVCEAGQKRTEMILLIRVADRTTDILERIKNVAGDQVV